MVKRSSIRRWRAVDLTVSERRSHDCRKERTLEALADVWTGFGAVWLATLAGTSLALSVARVRRWLAFRTQVRELERELDLLTRTRIP